MAKPKVQYSSSDASFIRATEPRKDPRHNSLSTENTSSRFSYATDSLDYDTYALESHDHSSLTSTFLGLTATTSPTAESTTLFYGSGSSKSSPASSSRLTMESRPERLRDVATESYNAFKLSAGLMSDALSLFVAPCMLCVDTSETAPTMPGVGSDKSSSGDPTTFSPAPSGNRERSHSMESGDTEDCSTSGDQEDADPATTTRQEQREQITSRRKPFGFLRRGLPPAWSGSKKTSDSISSSSNNNKPRTSTKRATGPNETKLRSILRTPKWTRLSNTSNQQNRTVIKVTHAVETSD